MRLLRPGGLAAEAIEALLGVKLDRAEHKAAIQAPGMLESHYAPDAAFPLAAAIIVSRESILAFRS